MEPEFETTRARWTRLGVSAVAFGVLTTAARMIDRDSWLHDGVRVVAFVLLSQSAALARARAPANVFATEIRSRVSARFVIAFFSFVIFTTIGRHVDTAIARVVAGTGEGLAVLLTIQSLYRSEALIPRSA